MKTHISQLLSLFERHLSFFIHVHFVAQKEDGDPLSCCFLKNSSQITWLSLFFFFPTEDIDQNRLCFSSNNE